MENSKVDKLIDKYLNGNATAEERERVLQWYRTQNDQEVRWPSESEEEENRIHTRIKNKIWSATVHTAKPVRSLRKVRYAITAAAIALIGAFVYLNLYSADVEDLDSTTIIAEVDIQQVENRFVLLPDSSKVILRPGSRLEFRSDFKGTSREIALIGEGYFDIVRMENKPFIIHTGKIKTVVLGTAFTIKADAQNAHVEVTVERGKVRVEKEDVVMGELVANQKISFGKDLDQPVQHKVIAAESLGWTSQDVRFDAQSFGQLTARLERRYKVKITFANSELSVCPVSGKFQGIETLDEMLTILCATRNARYRKIDDQHIEIIGQGCQ